MVTLRPPKLIRVRSLQEKNEHLVADMALGVVLAGPSRLCIHHAKRLQRMLISKCGGCDSFWIVIAPLQIEFIAKKNRGHLRSPQIEFIAKKNRGREEWLAPAASNRSIAKKNRGHLRSPQIEFIAKKNRGREG